MSGALCCRPRPPHSPPPHTHTHTTLPAAAVRSADARLKDVMAAQPGGNEAMLAERDLQVVVVVVGGSRGS